jgi:hypothetical protein
MIMESLKFPEPAPEGLPDGVAVLYRAGSIRKYINSLGGVIPNNSFAAAKDTVEQYSEQELAAQIWLSKEDDWQQKPAFFSELCDAYYLKMKAKNEAGK